MKEFGETVLVKAGGSVCRKPPDIGGFEFSEETSQ